MGNTEGNPTGLERQTDLTPPCVMRTLPSPSRKRGTHWSPGTDPSNVGLEMTTIHDTRDAAAQLNTVMCPSAFMFCCERDKIESLEKRLTAHVSPKRRAFLEWTAGEDGK